MRVGLNLGCFNFGILPVIKKGFGTLSRRHAHVVAGIRNNPKIGFQIAVKHHFPGFRALDPKIFRDFPLFPKIADLRAYD